MRTATVWTWNVNGLDDARLDERTEAACFVLFLRPDPPDVLLLQEVVRRSWHAHWKHHLRAAGYRVFPEDPTATDSHYFALVAVREEHQPGAAAVERFPGTEMGRALVTVEVGAWLVATGHLESGRGAADERVRQLGRVCERLLGWPGPAVFGGDTNLRVEEEKRVAGLDGLTDAWKAMGSPSEARATWFGGTSRGPGARFDRVLCNARARVTAFARLAAEPLPELGPISDHAALAVALEGAGG